MKKDDTVYVHHMLEYASRAWEKVENIERGEFDGDDNLKLAVTYLLQTIGEAAARVSQEFRNKCPDVPWPPIIGMRHKLVHGYVTVSYDQVWQTAKNELEPLIE
ncbi:MAG: DUF86 domain-containing protein [Planctomycetes bacterium]|nr:DUF86 domain-containing protein [Planctomycetota bacterium]